MIRLERGKRSIRPRIGNGSSKPLSTLKDDNYQLGDLAISLMHRSSIIRAVIHDKGDRVKSNAVY